VGIALATRRDPGETTRGVGNGDRTRHWSDGCHRGRWGSHATPSTATWGAHECREPRGVGRGDHTRHPPRPGRGDGGVAPRGVHVTGFPSRAPCAEVRDELGRGRRGGAGGQAQDTPRVSPILRRCPPSRALGISPAPVKILEDGLCEQPAVACSRPVQLTSGLELPQGGKARRPDHSDPTRGGVARSRPRVVGNRVQRGAGERHGSGSD
jgi:hypothetical protein